MLNLRDFNRIMIKIIKKTKQLTYKLLSMTFTGRCSWQGVKESGIWKSSSEKSFLFYLDIWGICLPRSECLNVILSGFQLGYAPVPTKNPADYSD